jgi:hypothetical protein
LDLRHCYGEVIRDWKHALDVENGLLKWLVIGIYMMLEDEYTAWNDVNVRRLTPSKL